MEKKEISSSFKELGEAIGTLIDKKNELYGSSLHKCGKFLEILFPNGVKPEQYSVLLIFARMFDKLSRIATGKDKLEDPWADLAGYSLLALNKDLEENKDRELFLENIKKYILDNTPK